jgi:acyl-CoA reductase-like NAD-dependent aldehyde dehydrogenase
MSLPHIPILRQGIVYHSLDKIEIKNPVDGSIVAQVSQANSGLIRRDLNNIKKAFDVLRSFSCEELILMSNNAGKLFMQGDLPLFEGGSVQSPNDYMASLSASSGLPFALIKKNMQKIYEVFTEMPTIIKGLTRGLSLDILDTGIGTQSDVPVSYFPSAHALGAVLPSNSPGVNSLWMPSIVLKIPVVLKPGREEPWTPCRIIQAFIEAGVPKEAFSFYPTSHEGAATVIDCTDRTLVFGGEDTVSQYANNTGVQVHGPGWSKVIIGDDLIEDYKKYIDVIIASVATNSGRSCINASALVVPKYAKEIATEVAQVLANYKACDKYDDAAQLAAFANPKMAEFIDYTIKEGLKVPGAIDLTAQFRGSSDRKVVIDNCTYLLPTVIWCDSPEHPLFNKEFLFPYLSVTHSSEEELLDIIGPSLVVSLITEKKSLIKKCLNTSLIDRLNIGPISTIQVDWDQPHEGNLFEFLYKRRAIQLAKV